MANNSITNKQMRDMDSGVLHTSTTISRHERRKKAALERLFQANNLKMQNVRAKVASEPIVEKQLWFNDYNVGIHRSAHTRVNNLMQETLNKQHSLQPLMALQVKPIIVSIDEPGLEQISTKPVKKLVSKHGLKRINKKVVKQLSKSIDLQVFKLGKTQDIELSGKKVSASVGNQVPESSQESVGNQVGAIVGKQVAVISKIICFNGYIKQEKL